MSIAMNKSEIKEYLEWLLPYTEAATDKQWEDYDCEYDTNLTPDIVDLMYKLYRLDFSIWNINRTTHECDTPFLSNVENRKNIFCTDAIIAKYKNYYLLFRMYNGQGTSNAVKIVDKDFVKTYGAVDLDKYLEDLNDK